MRRMVKESVPSVGFVYILNDTAPIRWEAMCSLWVNGKICVQNLGRSLLKVLNRDEIFAFGMVPN